jgi:hypothetical protein
MLRIDSAASAAER